MDLRKTFATALDGIKPGKHPEMPATDAPWYWEYMKKNGGHTDPFPGLHLRKVNMERYNADKTPLERRNLKYYATIGSMPSMQEDPNMHICAHLYASDRNSLFVMFVKPLLAAVKCGADNVISRSNHIGIGNNYSQIASLSHTVIFHADGEELSMTDPSTGQARWFCQEAWTGGSRHGRGLHQSRMWRDEDGLQIASTIQDGLVRLRRTDGKLTPGFSPQAMVKELETSGSGKKAKL